MLGFPGGLVVKNPLCNAGDPGSSPGQGTKIPEATEQLSLHSTTAKSAHSEAWIPQLESCAPQWNILPATTQSN